MNADDIIKRYPRSLVDRWIVAGAKRYEARKLLTKKPRTKARRLNARLKELSESDLKTVIADLKKTFIK